MYMIEAPVCSCLCTVLMRCSDSLTHMVLAAGNVLLWKRELSTTETFSTLNVDPLDRRRLCLCGNQGALVVLQLDDPQSDRVEQKQYRVNLQHSQQGELFCRLSARVVLCLLHS